MRSERGIWPAILISGALMGLSISGCTQAPRDAPPPQSPDAPAEAAPEPTPPPPPPAAEEAQPLLEEGVVSFTTDDGLTLSGTVFGTGTTAVILAHMRPVDQTDWHPFAQIIADDGFTALTFDFRGYGTSEGNRNDVGHLHLDVEAALAFLRDAGFDAILCVGASMGGTACAKAAHEPGVAGLIVISSPAAMVPPLELAAADFQGLNYPKLFIAAESDQPYRDAVQFMYDASSDPREIHIYSGNAHGTFLFGTEHEEEFRELLRGFLVEHAPRLDPS